MNFIIFFGKIVNFSKFFFSLNLIDNIVDNVDWEHLKVIYITGERKIELIMHKNQNQD